MKTLFTALLLVTIGVPITLLAQEKKSAGRSEGDQVGAIMKYRQEGEQKLNDNKLTKKEVALTGPNIQENIKQKWSKMDAYYEGDKLVRIQLYPHQGVTERTEEFYLRDGKLVFAFIQDKGPKHEGKDAGEAGKEFYFHNDKLIKFEDRSGEREEHADQEKKMYESRLPYEITELNDILKNS